MEVIVLTAKAVTRKMRSRPWLLLALCRARGKLSKAGMFTAWLASHAARAELPDHGKALRGSQQGLGGSLLLRVSGWFNHGYVWG